MSKRTSAEFNSVLTERLRQLREEVAAVELLLEVEHTNGHVAVAAAPRTKRNGGIKGRKWKGGMSARNLLPEAFKTRSAFTTSELYSELRKLGWRGRPHSVPTAAARYGLVPEGPRGKKRVWKAAVK